MSGPFAAAAFAYRAAGWHPVPLPPRSKTPPPAGWTGYAGRVASGADIQAWIDGGKAEGNVGLRMPETVLGLDLDNYDDKPGLATMLASTDVLGTLPPSPRSTSRADDPVSGIRFYRVPAGRRWADVLGPGVEVIHHGHRYAVAAPSVHPEGRTYDWLTPDGDPVELVPVADLPDLPATWVAKLDRGSVDDLPAKAALRDGQTQEWLDALPSGSMCAYLTRLVEELAEQVNGGASRHDLVRDYIARMVRGGDQGHSGAQAAVDTAESLFIAQRPLTDPLEVARMVSGAVAMCVATPWPVIAKGCCSPEVTMLQPPPQVARDQVSKIAHLTQTPESEGEAATEAAFGASWRPLDLTSVLRGLQDGTLTRPEPTVGIFDTGRALFYPARVNGIHGDSNAGKTWTALAACAQEIRGGNAVVYLDLEDNAEGVVARLLDQGADAADVLARFVYVNPADRLDSIARGLLGQVLDDHEPSLVVIDSTGEGLSLEGANPNADEEVAKWFRSLPRFVADHGPAVLVLDHMAKADDGALWPIGSQRKRAAINGAQYVQRIARPFSRDTAGAAVLICAKDRGGNYRAGLRVAELRVTPHGEGLTVALVAAPDDHTITGGTFRPTVLMERVSRAVELAHESLTFNNIAERVKGKRAGVRTAVDVLIAEGHITTTPGSNRATLHTIAKPYREAEDAGEPPGAKCGSMSGSGGSGSLGGEPGTTGIGGSGNHWGTTGEPQGIPPADEAQIGACPDCGADLQDDPGSGCGCPDLHGEVA